VGWFLDRETQGVARGLAVPWAITFRPYRASNWPAAGSGVGLWAQEVKNILTYIHNVVIVSGMSEAHSARNGLCVL
jgi:hypothetical protein